MKKHIKWEVLTNDEGKKYIRILEQSHIQDEFGDDGKNYFRASNGVELSSFNYPEYVTEYTLYLRGDDTSRNLSLISIPPIHLSFIIAALEEYNQHFNKQKTYLIDGSYSLTVTSDGLKHTFPARDKPEVKVIATGLVLPTDETAYSGKNNTIVTLLDGTVVFTQMRFIKTN